MSQVNNTKIFLKPIDGIGGSGCILLTIENIEKQMTKYSDILLNTSYIY
ncbi:hypothetical protein V8G56_10875 [Gaetbulibacter aquiaggeris]|uniref:Prokaryotic glutathione synthetase ATP-binding domain-containing protein n=1 Tax=Gaetbulibacter aquiaggeris TaxID=1735373 RepID=A0ABW7MQW0_9FLAO